MTDQAHLEGYRECHTCAVREKMESRRCYHCTGRLDLRDLLLLQGEKKYRRSRAPILSAIVPGLGHWYSGRRYIGTYFFAMAPLSVGLVLATYQKWNWGLSVLTLSFVLVWLLAILDSKRGPFYFQPPCQLACPGRISCSQYVHLAAKGDERASLELVEAVCPFPGTIGRICHHPCEQECNRGKDGEPVAICTLKRFVDDNVDKDYNFYRRELDKNRETLDRRVAVVGSGPSGLSAALYLRLFGFDVSLFEAREFGGGTPAIYAPGYRLPREIYRREVDRILELDLDLRFGQRLGSDFTLQDLEAEGFAAAYLALGAMRSIRLPHTGEEAEGFLDGREFLENVVMQGDVRLEGEALVIGGGNVAMDVARSALRCGAAKVRVICLEKRPEPEERVFTYEGNVWTRIRPSDTGQFMPAHPWEIDQALAEGVEIIDGGATVSFERRNGKVVRAHCLRVERIDKDEKGRLIPVLMDGTDFTVNADWVITAVGSAPDFSFLGGVPAHTRVSDEAALIRLDKATGVSMPVLAGGDLATGPASVIEAIAAGKEAALYIFRVLVGSPSVSIRYRTRRIMEPWANYPDSLDHRARRKEIQLPVPERLKSFGEVCGGFAGKVAREEAERCMRCDWPLMRESKVKKYFRSQQDN
ncbi:MAG: FAD-dependent oxidoreductase [bacterium]|nr:MAG: FAD-dependent oxidoreductase [bacterium]